MPRGYPDDNIQTNPLGQTIADNAELAARLGSVSVITRSGQVIYQTNFKDGITDWMLGKLEDGYVKCRGNLGVQSSCCMEIYSGVASGALASAVKYLPMIDLLKVGIEFNIMFDYADPEPDANIIVVYYITIEDKFYQFLFNIKPYSSEIVITYHAGGGVYLPYTITLPFSLVPDTGKKVWHYFKMVLDPENVRYYTLLVDSYAYNLQDLGAVAGSYTAAPGIVITFLESETTYSIPFHIGTCVVTMNEA
jgi:hypothetical protein